MANKTLSDFESFITVGLLKISFSGDLKVNGLDLKILLSLEQHSK